MNPVLNLETRISFHPVLKVLFGRVREIKPPDAAHDFNHILRVCRETAKIFNVEIKRLENREATQDEIDTCFAAALLHDCVPVAKSSPLRKESSRLASDQARTWLTELQWPAHQIENICDAIWDHSFSAERIPKTLLGEALQDADRLEALGALGLYRTIATGVAMKAELFHQDDPWAKNRALDDQYYSIDHFYTKLLGLPATFKTTAAKAEALKRANFLEQFLLQLRSEIDP